MPPSKKLTTLTKKANKKTTATKKIVKPGKKIVAKPVAKTTKTKVVVKSLSKLASKSAPKAVSKVVSKTTSKVAAKTTKVAPKPVPKTTKVVPAVSKVAAVTKTVVKAMEVEEPKKKTMNRGSLFKKVSRLELLDAIKICNGKGLIPSGPDFGGINKLDKKELLKYVPPHLVTYIYKLILKTKKQITERKLEGDQKMLFERFSKYNCKVILDAIKDFRSTEAEKEHRTQIDNMYGSRKNTLILSIIDSGKAPEIANCLPELSEVEQEATELQDNDVGEEQQEGEMEEGEEQEEQGEEEQEEEGEEEEQEEEQEEEGEEEEQEEEEEEGEEMEE
jgi:hypothetical protein